MVVDNEIEKIRRQLDLYDNAQLALYGADIHIRTLDDASQLTFVSPVYEGSAYIPASIRHCVKNQDKPFFQAATPTFLSVDENHFAIFLNYKGEYEEDPAAFKSLLEDFGYQAAEWRLYLDEKDRQDHVHVYAR